MLSYYGELLPESLRYSDLFSRKPGRVELQRPASLLCFSREAFGTSESHANCFSLEPKVIYPKYYKHSNELGCQDSTEDFFYVAKVSIAF
jgi:hypothetical protein